MSLQDYLSALVSLERCKEFSSTGGLSLIQAISFIEMQAEEMSEEKLNSPILGLVKPHSYRGYYECLAFEEGETTIAKMLNLFRSCIGTTFHGYKGGDFYMDEGAFVYIAEYGCTGEENELTLKRLNRILKGEANETTNQ